MIRDCVFMSIAVCCCALISSPVKSAAATTVTYPPLLFLEPFPSPQIWVGCCGRNTFGGQWDAQTSRQVLVVNPESHTVTKELHAHSDSIQTLCSAEDRYVLSGSARRDGKIAIWKVE